MRMLAFSLGLVLIAGSSAAAQTTAVSGTRPARLIIRNATVVDGNGTPARGPFDIVVSGGKITQLIALDPVALGRNGSGRRPRVEAGTAEIDASGKYVLPGLINAHAHLQDERAGVAQPIDYELKIWLACGITAIRDVGSDTRKALAWRDASTKGTLAAPRIFIYPQFGRPTNADSARQHVRDLKAMGVDGIKLLGIDRDIMAAMEDEAHKNGMRVAHHVGVEETNAWDDIHFGTTSIEHWYGIPDAAIIDGVQNFPSYYNYNNETDRFRWAGHLWREADPARLSMVLDSMVARHVAWVPTFDIYEASRDLQRAKTQPWFIDYLHPTLEEYFRPDPSNHGSYFFGWTSTDETFWKENYRIWMGAVRDFEKKGGLVGAGDDAGFIYEMYGFGLLRELELHQEAGFNTIKVIQHATFNNARILGKEAELGRVRPGFDADLIVVNGNPLENLKVLYPTGVDDIKDGKAVHTGGVEWTIKDGIPYHGPTLMRDVKAMVAKARAERGQKADKTSPGTLIRWIAFVLSIATAFLAFWMVVPAPTYFLLTFGVGAREISAWLLVSSLVAIRLAAPSVRESRISQVAMVLCIVSFVIAASPFVRLPAVINRFNEQTRLISTEPRVPTRAHPVVISDLFGGIERQPVQITRNVTFAVPGTRLALDIYQPFDSLAPGAPPVLHPIIVQIYGGAWQRGAPADNGDFAEWAANAGYVVFAIDYRHAPLFRWPAQLQDVDSSLVWIRDHAAKYGGDASRVVLMGRSAGGHIALMAAYSSPPIPISGVISYYGPTELPDSYRHPPHPDPLKVRSNMEALLGGPLDAMPDRYIAASPTSLAARMQPPTLLIYGAADHIVEAKYGALLRDKLKASGTQVAYLEIPWAEHAFDAVFQGPSSQLALYYVERFLAMTTIRSESSP